MKIISASLVSACFIVYAVYKATAIKKRTVAADEALKFTLLAKRLIAFRSVPFSELLDEGKKENYKYISFSGSEIKIDDCAGERLVKEFSDFVNNLGTTDCAGQIALCSEYSERFSAIFLEYENTGKEKVRVNGALSALGAFCSFILLL